MRLAFLPYVIVSFGLACGEDGAGTDPDAGAVREMTHDLTVDSDGRSEELRFAVPPETRSVTVIVEGDVTSPTGWPSSGPPAAAIS